MYEMRHPVPGTKRNKNGAQVLGRVPGGRQLPRPYGAVRHATSILGDEAEDFLYCSRPRRSRVTLLIYKALSDCSNNAFVLARGRARLAETVQRRIRSSPVMGDNLSQDAIDELHALRAIYEDDIKIDLVCATCSGSWKVGQQDLLYTLYLPRDYPHSAAPVLDLRSHSVDRATLDWWATHLAQSFNTGAHAAVGMGDARARTPVPGPRVPGRMLSWTVAAAEEAYTGSPAPDPSHHTLFAGEPILFDWIETLKRKLETLAEILADSDESEEDSEEEEYEEEPHECWEHGAGPGSALPQGGGWAPPSDAGRLSQVLDRRRTDLPEIVHGEPFTEKKSTFQAHLCRVKSHEDVR